MGKLLKWIAGITAGIMLAYGVSTNYAFAKTPDGFSMTSKNKPSRSIAYDVRNMKVEYTDKFKSKKNDLDTIVSYDFKNKMIGTSVKDNIHSIGSSINYDTAKKVAGVNINTPKYNGFATLEKDSKYTNLFNKYLKDTALYTPYGNFYHTR